jgi:hypothetical protein
MEIHLISYYIGITIILISQIWILWNNNREKTGYISIIGLMMIAYYFVNKERMMDRNKKD